MKYTTKIGSRGNQFQENMPAPAAAAMPLPCPITISVMFRLADTMSTTTRQKPMAISKLTICAEARSAPKNAYLELEAQPAMITP